MRTTTTTGRVRSTYLSAVVVAIVLGILGMHALTMHDVGAGPAHHPGGTSAHTEVAASADPAVLPAGEAMSAASDESGRDMGDMGDMVMLCGAMLAAAGALVLLALAVRRVPRWWITLASTPLPSHRFTFPHLATGPPAVWRFSVVRC